MKNSLCNFIFNSLFIIVVFAVAVAWCITYEAVKRNSNRMFYMTIVWQSIVTNKIAKLSQCTNESTQHQSQFSKSSKWIRGISKHRTCKWDLMRHECHFWSVIRRDEGKNKFDVSKHLVGLCFNNNWYAKTINNKQQQR